MIIECTCCGEPVLIIHGEGKHPKCPGCGQKLNLRPQEPWTVNDGTEAELRQEIKADAVWTFGNDGTCASNRIDWEQDGILPRDRMHIDFGWLYPQYTNSQKVRDLELDPQFTNAVRNYRKNSWDRSLYEESK
jgi:hypothetical protein